MEQEERDKLTRVQRTTDDGLWAGAYDILSVENLRSPA